VHRLAHRVGNLAGAGLLDIAANRVRHLLGVARFDHAANLVAAGLGDLLRYHPANSIALGLGDLLRNHLADGVVANLGSFFGNHVADLVGTDLGSLFRNHSADLVGALLDSLFPNHVAHLVTAGFGARFADVATFGVRNHLLADLTFVTHAVDQLGGHTRHPDLLANRAARDRAGDNSALAWNPNATAATRIPLPATWITNALFHATIRALVRLRFPVSTTNLYFLGVVNRLANGVANFTLTGFVDGLANGVADRASLRFPNRLADRVTNVLDTSLVNGPLDGVTHRFLTCFPAWLVNRVTNRLLTGFVTRFVDRVANVLRSGFPNGFADGVTDLLGASFPNRLAGGVVARSVACFVNRLASGVGAVAITSLADVSHTIDCLCVINRVVHRLVAGVLLLFVHFLTASLHYRVALLFGAAIVGRFIASAVLVASRAKVGSENIARHHHCHEYYNGQRPFSSSHHLFSFSGFSSECLGNWFADSCGELASC
jgi:hypothetical protein